MPMVPMGKKLCLPARTPALLGNCGGILSEHYEHDCLPAQTSETVHQAALNRLCAL